MNKYNTTVKKIEEWVTIFFFCAGIFMMFLLTQALILTWFNQFKILFLSFSVFISFILTVIFYYFIKKDIKLLPRLNIPVLVIIFLVCLIFIFFPHDTFGGRDEGLYANLSIYLTNHGNLNTPSHLNANPAVIQRWTGRVPAYTTWLAIQNIFFGQNWLLRSGTILTAFGLFYLYLVGYYLGGKKVSLITLIFYASCFPFLWLGRETLSENLAFFLLWTSIVFLFTFFKTKRNIYLVGLFTASWLLSFSRLEGLFIQFLTLLVLISTVLITKIASLRKTIFIALIYLIFIASTFLIYDHVSDTKYLEENIFSGRSAVIEKSFSSVLEKQNKHIQLNERFPIFIMQMLAKYNLLLIIFSIFLVIPIIVVDKKMSLKNKIYLIGLLIIISPEFIKLINPGISLDQPWFYRRYVYALIPLGYLCFSILLNKIAKRRLLVIIVFVLFTINIILSSKIITLKNNWSVTKALEKITKNVSPRDLIMINSRTVFDNYNPTAYLTYQKEIRSFYSNWMEVKSNNWLSKEKIFQGIPYKRLFLLSDKESESYKDFKLLKIDSLEVKYKQLQFICELPLLGTYLRLYNVYNYSILPYSEVIKYCSKTDNEILNVKKNIFLYELN